MPEPEPVPVADTGRGRRGKLAAIERLKMLLLEGEWLGSRSSARSTCSAAWVAIKSWVEVGAGSCGDGSCLKLENPSLSEGGDPEWAWPSSLQLECLIQLQLLYIWSRLC